MGVQVPAEKEIERPAAEDEGEAPQGQGLVFGLGLAGMGRVPVFTAVTQCPPWCGMMFVLGMLGVITSLLPTGGNKKFNLPGALAPSRCQTACSSWASSSPSAPWSASAC